MPRKYFRGIRISGPGGVGTSSTFKGIKEACGTSMTYLSGGDSMRQRAAACNMPIEEFVALLTANPGSIHDRAIDEAIWEFGKKHDTVIEARLAYLSPGFQVHLDAPLIVRAWRRYKYQNKENLPFLTVWRRMKTRDKKDQDRFPIMYPGCRWTKEEFDLHLNTWLLSKQEVVNAILDGYRKWVAKKTKIGRMWEV